MRRSNQSMKPTAPFRNTFEVLATTPSTSSRFPATLVRFTLRAHTLPPYCYPTIAVAYDVFFPQKHPSSSRPCRTASRGLHSLSR